MSRTRSLRGALFNSTALVGLSLASTLLLAGFAPPAQAQNWTGSASDDWFTAANWDDNQVPVDSSVRINTVNPYPTVIDGDDASAFDLDIANGPGLVGNLSIVNGGTLNSRIGLIGQGAGSTGVVVVDGLGSRWTIDEWDVTLGGGGGDGSLTISNGGYFSARDVFVAYGDGSRGTLTVTGTGSQFTVDGSAQVGSGGAGTINVLDGGTATISSLSIGYYIGSVGTATVSGTGSSLVVGRYLFVGAGPNATGTLTVGDGGAVTANGGSGVVELGTRSDSARGVVNIGAAPGSAAVAPGTLNAAGVNTSAGSEINFNHTATAYDFAPQIDGAAAVRVFSGTTTLTASNTYTGGTFLNGGTLSVAADANLGDASGGLTFDGGTLQNRAAFTTARDITLNAGGGTFQTDADLTVSGVVDGSGSLTKTGAGTLTLTGVNGYTGGTTVSDGRLIASVTGALGTGPVTIGEAIGTSGVLEFTGSAQAGTLAIRVADLTSSLSFAQNASAGAATIDNSGLIFFSDTSSAGTATIVSDSGIPDGNYPIPAHGGGVIFRDSATAGNATITNLTDSGVYFTGNNTADGATIINSGLVDISNLDADDIGIGSLSGAGTVYLGSKSLTLSGLGKNDTIAGALLDGGDGLGTGGALTKIGAGTLTLTGANGYTGGTTVEAGTLDIGGGGATGSIAGNVDVAAGATLAFNRSNDFAFAGTIGGDGAVGKLGAGAATLTGNSAAFTGTTSVNAGTLVVDGTLGGVIDVLSGARLEGTGTVGTTTIASGGTIAPGHSPGTLTVAGDITFAAGSTYEVDITPALDGDLIDASGSATINGGTVDVVKAAGTYVPGSRWTIIGADGGVTGTFDALTQNMPFVDLALAYDPSHVYLDVARNDVAFCDVAQTSNQCTTGDAIESSGQGNAVYDAVAAVTDEGSARVALDALSGEIHASLKGTMLEDSRFVREAALDRTRAAFSGVAAPSLPVMGYGSESLTPEQQEALAREGKSAEVFAPAPADTDRFAVWARGFGSWGQWDSDGNAADFERSIGGLFIGADAAVAETWRLGLLTGYSRSSFDADDLTSSGDSDNYHLGLYGGTEWGNLGLRLGAAHTWHDIETGRSIAFPGFADSAQASYDARTAQAFGELGYRIDSGNFAFEPFANLAYVNVHTSGFTEEGGAAALASASSDTDATFTTLGLRAATDFSLGGVTATARGMVGWRHAFGDVTPLSSFAFAGSDAFTIAGTPIAEDALVLEAGFDVGLSETTSLGVSYSGQVASKASDHGFRADFTVKF
jgi:fibronectin-binding autotransporter adhesin